MEVESQQLGSWEGYVDWRNRPALRGRHGGMLAAAFVLGDQIISIIILLILCMHIDFRYLVVEVLENLAFLANASNLVIYFIKFMHFSPSNSANSVTNFMGTAFLLALLGGFLSDAFRTTYVIYLISAVIEFLGLVILTIQARSDSLKPPKCDPATPNVPCPQVHGAQSAMLFTGLYLVALGVGGIKGSLPVHGAEQFDQDTPKGRKQKSTFFNYFVFCLSCGALIAVTLVVWVEDNMGWQWGFGISTVTILLTIPIFLLGSKFYRNKIPSGSPFTTIAKVLIAALLNSCNSRSSTNAVVSMGISPSPTPVSKEEDGVAKSIAVEPIQETPSPSLSFLNRAVGNKASHGLLYCSVKQVEEVKIVIKILPIFACTIILNCCLAQLSTFSVQQADTMDTKLGSLTVPPASLPIFPVVFTMILAPLYDHFIVPFFRRTTKTEMGISHLQRIGIGLILSIVAMAVAALVEIKRKRVVTDNGLFDSQKPLPITFFWIALQYLFLGSADLFTLAGLMEFFFTEAPTSMRSLATALSWASLAMGYYLSTAIVSIVNSATGNNHHKPWLKGRNFNDFHLDRFYWLMCVLSGLNFLQYLFWAMRYKYRSVKGPN